jgi:hypothetical protein
VPLALLARSGLCVHLANGGTTMTIWRMAMREGNGGDDFFSECFDLGIAAICYTDEKHQPIVGDCRKLTPEQYEEAWKRRAPRNTTGRVSLRRVAYEIKKGDAIYAKDGVEIEGKGTVIGTYEHRTARSRIPRNTYEPWCHVVRVRWEKGFRRFTCRLGAEQWTVLKLEGLRLRKLLAAERKARKGGAAPSDANMKKPARRQSVASARRKAQARRRRVEDDLNAGAADCIVGTEGEVRRRLVLQRKREWRLRDAKINATLRDNGNRLRCEVPGCGFDFEAAYGRLGKRFAEVHHVKPLGRGKGKRPSRVEDLRIVCANCHRMIHKDGKCRDLNSIRPRVSWPG